MATKHFALAGVATLAILTFPLSAGAQGIPRGAADGAFFGSQAVGTICGAIGAVVGGITGGVVGGVTGGVVGGVMGIAGIPQQTSIPVHNYSYRRR